MAELTNEVILSTAYFPDIFYCRQLNSFPKVTIDLGESFVKQSRRSRCEVLGPNGKIKLIVPLQKWKSGSPVKDVRISYTDNWRKLHWRSLESAYRSSPYFEYYEDKFDKLINRGNHVFLADLNAEILNFISSVLNISSAIGYSNDYVQARESMDDLRGSHTELLPDGETKKYTQVFARGEFVSNLSIIDLICNEGPNSINLL